ncbi:MAG: DUF2085 domain-containing protein [Bacteroidetes bacterium]|nr:DUF2085 domain-containing protein [Bacteroidota bacterium]
MRWSWLAYLLLTIPALLWITGLFLAPVTHACGRDDVAILSRLFFSPVCHQDVARTFHPFAWPMNVCHRCSGIYLAFTGILLLFPFLRQTRMFRSFSFPMLLLLLVPLLLDYILDVLGIWVNSPFSRVASGVLVGGGLALFIVPAWMEMWTSWRNPSPNESREVSP